ncbi:hypothetical protein [Paenibacillus ginsengarvi]|uniref:Neutral/alkaline non-lysosomal ceramidase N-terminal domain-containing protein n=1 Tax=Paenibacillus ginsengarvi TaxID=400777 RepID=A0A3B0AMV5_9BACL|nr:hypothetical protein [Paenibacillus ginsengarvi]RKN62000.1 hypothetical protein D7M11_35145 [Paenibacillus ginsengarvi]
MSQLKGAFRKVLLTPEEISPLQGYDPNTYIANPETDVLDDLYARVAVLDDGIQRKVIVSIDCCLTNETTFQAADPSGQAPVYRHLLQTFPEGTRCGWGEAAGVEEASVSVHATHTHSAPEHFGEKYTARIRQAIRNAANELQPLRARAGSGETGVSVNRRPRLQHNDELPIDRSLHAVVFETDDGRPVGGIVNCAVHPTLLINPLHRISSEFVGLAMKEWEQEYGDGFAALFIQGFSGDVGPHGHYRNEPDDTYPWVQRLGHELYGEIATIAGRAEPIKTLPLESAEVKVGLPTRAMYFKPSIDVTLHGLRLGEFVLVSVSCEVFNGYAGILRSFCAAPYMLFAGVSNGYCGYLPTAQAYGDGLGGYEMNTTPYRAEASDLFVQAAKQLIAQLH